MPNIFEKEKPKGDQPILRGLAEERDGQTRISLWETDRFEELIKQIVKRAILEYQEER